jgi:hypothetical protein
VHICYQGVFGHLWGDHEAIDFEEVMASMGFVVIFPTGPIRKRYEQDVNSWLNRSVLSKSALKT